MLHDMSKVEGAECFQTFKHVKLEPCAELNFAVVYDGQAYNLLDYQNVVLKIDPHLAEDELSAGGTGP